VSLTNRLTAFFLIGLALVLTGFSFTLFLLSLQFAMSAGLAPARSPSAMVVA